MVLIAMMIPFIFFGLIVVFLIKASANNKKNREEILQNANPEVVTKFRNYYKELLEDPEFSRYKLSWFQRNKKTLLFLIIIVVINIAILNFLIDISLFPIIIFGEFFVVFISGIILVITGKGSNRNNVFKEKVIKRFLNDFYPKYYYEGNRGLSREEYGFKPFVTYYDSYSSDDYMEFMIGNNEVRMSEIYTTRTDTDSDGNSHTVVTFSGVAGYTDLEELTNEYGVFGVGRIFSSKYYVKLDDKNFNKYFRVISDNEMIAYKFFTPDIMNKFIEMNSRYPFFDYLLIGKRLYFRFHCGVLFTPTHREDDLIFNLLSYSKTLDRINNDLSKVINYIIDKDS